MFKKLINSDAPLIIGNTSEDAALFPPGFCYSIGSIIFTVKKDITQEDSSPMREVILSDGSTEIIPIESLKKDMRDPECKILEMDHRYTIKEQKKVVKKKVSKKKISKTAKKKVSKKKISKTAKKKVSKKNDR